MHASPPSPSQIGTEPPTTTHHSSSWKQPEDLKEEKLTHD